MVNNRTAHWTIYLVGALVLSLSACKKTVDYQTVLPARDMPALTKPVILTVVNRKGEKVQFDVPRLESLGTIKYQTEDPSRKNQRYTYEGVLLSSVLKYSNIGPNARLNLLAIDKYETQVNTAEYGDTPVILALKSEDQYLKLTDYGPIYMVFPYLPPKLPKPEYNRSWVWQLNNIREL